MVTGYLGAVALQGTPTVGTRSWRPPGRNNHSCFATAWHQGTDACSDRMEAQKVDGQSS